MKVLYCEYIHSNRSEKNRKKVYPAWLNFITPKLTRITNPEDAKCNNYYIISGNGYPSILDHIEEAVNTINEFNGIFTHFVIVADSDDDGFEQRKKIFKINYQNVI